MAKKSEAAASVEEMDIDHAEPRVYELGFHIDPELSNEEVKKTYQSIREIASKTGEIVAEGEPQKIQLAYTVSRSETGGRRDFDTSFFSWFAYETNGAGHGAVAQAVATTARVFRFLDIRTTKEAAQNSALLSEMMQKAAKDLEQEGEDEVSDAEIEQALKEVEV
jgi:ribosomal protein S6